MLITAFSSCSEEDFCLQYQDYKEPIQVWRVESKKITNDGDKKFYEYRLTLDNYNGYAKMFYQTLHNYEIDDKLVFTINKIPK